MTTEERRKLLQLFDVFEEFCELANMRTRLDQLQAAAERLRSTVEATRRAFAETPAG